MVARATLRCINALRRRTFEENPAVYAFNQRCAHSTKPLSAEPFLDQVGDLAVVLVHHHHVGIALDADLGQVNHIDFSSGRTDRVGIIEADLAHFWPAAVERDIVAVDHQRRDVFEFTGLRLVARNRRFDRHDGLDLVGPCLGHGETEPAGLAVKQQDAGTDLVDQRGVGRDDRCVGVGPARHDLLGEIVVGLDRKLAAGVHFHLCGIGIP